MKIVRAAGACALLAALAVPTAASAHGTVYTHTAKVVVGPTPPPNQGGLEDQVRYVVTNHGFTYVLRETNGITDSGMVDYSQLPSAYRNQPGFEPGPAGTRTRLLSEGDSGAQPHATCDVPELMAEPAILAWQGEDPFYNYVPFQKGMAGLEDDPALWHAVVEDETGVDLSGVEDADLETVCEALPGADAGSFRPADETQTAAASLASGTIAEATAPLEAQVGTLQAALTAAQQARDTAQGALATAQASLATANAELARVMPLARRFSVALPTAQMKARSLANDGARVSIAGPPLKTVSLRLTVSKAVAKRLGLSSGLLARRTASIEADGSSQVTLKPKRAVARKLRAMRGSARLTLAASGGDRTDTARGTVSR